MYNIYFQRYCFFLFILSLVMQGQWWYNGNRWVPPARQPSCHLSRGQAADLPRSLFSYLVKELAFNVLSYFINHSSSPCYSGVQTYKKEEELVSIISKPWKMKVRSRKHTLIDIWLSRILDLIPNLQLDSFAFQCRFPFLWSERVYSARWNL